MHAQPSYNTRFANPYQTKTRLSQCLFTYLHLHKILINQNDYVLKNLQFRRKTRPLLEKNKNIFIKQDVTKTVVDILNESLQLQEK